MARLRIEAGSLALLFLLSFPSLGSAVPVLGVWLDGNTTRGSGPIPFSLTAAFGAASFTLVTTAQLETPGTALTAPAVAIIQSHAGSGAS